MDTGLHVKYPSFYKIPKFSETSQTSNFMKIRSVGAEFVPCDKTNGRTDVTKLVVAFRSFANAPKTVKICLIFMVPCIIIQFL